MWFRLRPELPCGGEPAGLRFRRGDSHGPDVWFTWIARRAVEHRGRDVAIRAVVPAAEVLEDLALDRTGMEEANPVHRALLAETIDAPDTLLEAKRIPRQLDIDDKAASVMQIQTLARGIGRNQHIDATAIERIDRLPPVIRRKATVNEPDAPRRR